MALGNGERHDPLVGVQAGVAAMDISVAVPQKTRKRATVGSTISLLAVYSKDSISCCRETCVSILTDALFTVARTWKQSRCPSTDAWIMKIW